ncbi:hypothetical protein IEO21_01994 [Rhodonia placenta]|uniref:SAP domain-containing protein n=1 Tax=Rhodonia placenta TaxID=104341 RepID=A0A8H7P8N8_9APHY|nr:hypothetical protein IEO21_01994 [Postia placenta]
MNTNALRKLTRPQIQKLATREGIKAIGKKEHMIEQLLKKLPKGVPPLEAKEPAVRRSARINQKRKRIDEVDDAEETDAGRRVRAKLSDQRGSRRPPVASQTPKGKKQAAPTRDEEVEIPPPQTEEAAMPERRPQTNDAPLRAILPDDTSPPRPRRTRKELFL